MAEWDVTIKFEVKDFEQQINIEGNRPSILSALASILELIAEAEDETSEDVALELLRGIKLKNMTEDIMKMDLDIDNGVNFNE